MKEAYRIFARLHPVEAFDFDKLSFFQFMKEEGYNITNEEIEKTINECRDENSKP
jgi:hypothetical protein